MQERVRALSGTLELTRESGRTVVRCRLPSADLLQETPAAPETDRS
jgi:two-component system sensor histidine kinase UhpB